MKIRQIIISAVLAAGCIFTATGCSETSSVGNVGEITFVEGDKIAEINIQDYGTIKAKLFTDLAPIGVENFIQLAEQGYYDGLKIHRVVEGFMMQGGSLNGDGTGGTAIYSGEGTYDEDFGIEVDQRARHFYGALCYANSLGRNTAQFYIVNNKEPQDLSQFVPSQIKDTAAKYGEMKLECEEGSLEYIYYENYETYYTNLAEMIGGASKEVIEKYKTSGGTPSLDGGYTVFGQVFEGFSVIDAISAAAVETNAQGEKSKPVVDIIIDSVKIVTYTQSTAEATAEADNKGTQTNVNTSAPKTTSGNTTAAPTEPENTDNGDAPEDGANATENSGMTSEQADTGTENAAPSAEAPAESAEPSFQTIDTVEDAA